MSYLLDLLRAQFEGYKAAVPVESREFIEAKLEAAEARAVGAAAARAIRADIYAERHDNETRAINAALLEIRPGLGPRDLAVKVRGYVKRHKDEYDLEQEPSLRVIRRHLKSNGSSDIRAVQSSMYASTMASTVAST